MSPDPLQKHVQHLQALRRSNTLLVIRIRVKGILGLSPELDLCQHADQEFIDIVVDAGGRLDVLAVVLDGQRFAGCKIKKTRPVKTRGSQNNIFLIPISDTLLNLLLLVIAKSWGHTSAQR